MNNNLLLIYDDYCPLCKWYSGLFVKYNLLKENNRKAFSKVDDALLSIIDSDKSRNEIPLVNTETGKVLYGIDALLELLGNRYAWIKYIGNIKPVKWFLRKLYKLISYNRKVIVATKCSDGAFDCTPDYNFRYRTFFLLLGLFLNTFLLTAIHNVVLKQLPFYSVSLLQLQAAHFALVAMNICLAFLFPKEKAFEFLGQVNMLAITVIISFTPLLIASLFFTLPAFLITICLFGIALITFKEYIRRMHYAGILQHPWIAGFNIVSVISFIILLFH